MTTRAAFGGRKLTHQPISTDQNLAQCSQREVQGIFERHASPSKTPMQLFDEHQQLQCARLSVPNERRRRDRFGGTQNSFFYQTNGGSAMTV